MTARVAADGRTAGSAHPTIEVRVERLRDGRSDETLFLVPGMGGDPAELTELAAALAGPQRVYAVAPSVAGLTREAVPTMERMAECLVSAIRRVQPSGPYRLGGYSFGGMLALEMARQLHTAGETVAPLFLIEAVYDERYWPRGIWLRALARRTGRQLARIARMRPGDAVTELRLRGVRLVQRVVRRTSDAPDPLQANASTEVTAWDCAYAALAGYRPGFYAGPITLIASSVDRHFGCDTVRLWTGYAGRLDVQRVAGDHLTVMHGTACTAIAAVIDHRLALTRASWPGVRPAAGFARPMILTTMRWFSAARLAHAMVEAGFAVSACRPRGHALEVVEGLTADLRLSRLRQCRSLRDAIRRADPDIVLPGDERALVLLRRLHARTADPEVARVIAHSLGASGEWPSIASRTALADEARRLDIAVPATQVVRDAAALRTWTDRRGLPVVLKTDGSWGGRGVAIVRDAAHLTDAWRTLSRPPALLRSLKRLVLNREAGALEAWLRRVRPAVNAQEFVEGRDGIVTVACLDGEIKALVCLEVLRASEAKGPAAVIRVVEHAGLAEAARRLVRRFGLSGFCGFDFILTDTGEARLLELNPRLTPTSHLLVEGGHQRRRTIALFPAHPVPADEPGSAVAGVLDVPVRAPWLIARGERETARERGRLLRAGRRLRQRMMRRPF